VNTRSRSDLPAWFGMLLMALLFAAGGYVEQAMPDHPAQVQP
jgi:hypothetical protein